MRSYCVEKDNGRSPDDLEYWWPRRSPKKLEAEQRRRDAQAAREARAQAKALAESEKAARRSRAAAKKGARTRARNRSARKSLRAEQASLGRPRPLRQ